MEPAPGMDCERCRGEGWAVVERNGYSVSAPCPDCSDRRRLERFLAGLPGRYRNASRATWRGAWPLPASLDTWNPAPGCSPWLVVLLGPPGVGKTHAACGLLRGALERFGAEPLFVDWPAAVEAVKAGFDNREAGAKTEGILLGARPLLIDDAGSERVTEFSAGLTARVLRHRHAHQLPTILTSNAGSLADFGSIDPRVASRLAEDSVTVTLRGRDRRLVRP